LKSNSKAKIENFEMLKTPDGAFQDFWNFIKVNFGLDPKTLFDA
jgi:hypothetical protein